MLTEKFNPCDWGFIRSEHIFRICLGLHTFELDKVYHADDFWTLLRLTWKPEYDIYLSDETLGLDEITDNQSFYNDLNSLRSTEFDDLKAHLETMVRKFTIDGILQDLEDDAILATLPCPKDRECTNKLVGLAHVCLPQCRD